MNKLSIIFFLLFVCASFSLNAGISSRVQGTVVDKETKLPLLGAEVELIQFAAEGTIELFNWKTMTNKNGEFSFDVEPYGYDRYYLLCSKDGYIPQFRRSFKGHIEKSKYFDVLNVFKLPEGRIMAVTIALERGAVLKGKLLKKEQSGISPGENISGILTIRRDEKHSYLTKYDVDELNKYFVDGFETNNEGEFEIKGLEDGTYDVFISNDDYKDHYISKIQIAKGKTELLEQTLDYSIQNEVRGIIRKNGKPIISRGSIYFRLVYPDGSIESCGCGIQKDGSYSCKGLLPGKYQVIIATTGEDREPRKDRFEIEVLAEVTKKDFFIR